jgi:hypothetical protein
MSEHTAENDAATSTEWGVVIDDLGSCDMAESEEEARAWLAAGEGLSLVRIVVTEWPCPIPPEVTQNVV